MLHILNNCYIDRAPTYASHSFAVLNVNFDYSDANFLLHFWMEKAAFYNFADEIREFKLE